MKIKLLIIKSFSQIIKYFLATARLGAYVTSKQEQYILSEKITENEIHSVNILQMLMLKKTP